MGSSPTKTIVLHVDLKLIQKHTTNTTEVEFNNLEAPPGFQPVIQIKEEEQNGNNIRFEKKIEINNNEMIEKPTGINESMSLFNKENIKNIIKDNNDINNIDNNIDINIKKENIKNINDDNIDNNIGINIKNENIKSYTNEIDNPQEDNKCKTKFGEEEDGKEKDSNNISQTATGENKDINIANNLYQKQDNNDITPTIDGNKDNNLGSKYQNYQEKEKEDLEQSVIMKVENLEQSVEMIQKGYLPIFLKLNNCEALYFFIKEESTLKSLIRAYLKNNPKANKGLENDIKLYNGNKILDINKSIKELKLGYFSRISDKIGEK